MIAEKLRQAVLQAAISGHLTEQRPEDGTAEDLLDEIAAERERLIKKGKLKKTKPLPPVTPEEEPFEIPPTWKFSSLLKVTRLISSRGKQIKSKEVRKTGSIPVVSQGQELIDGYTNSELQAIDELPIILFGDHTRNVKYIDFSFVVGADGTKLLSSIKLPAKYFYYWCLHTSEQIKNRGYARHFSVLSKVPVSIPPILEAQRIADKLDQVMPYIDELAELERERESLDSAFFADLEQSILQAGISGHLTEQRPEDGTAEDLLAEIAVEREQLIKAGKLKKSKPLPPVTPDEEPFPIPPTWKWVHLGEMINLVSGRDMEPSQYSSTKQGIPYITGASNFDDGKILINRWTQQPSVVAKRGELLLTCKGTIGDMAILDEEEAHIARQIMAVSAKHGNLDFIKFLLSYSISKLKSAAKSMIPGISRETVINLEFPLAPDGEQKRIADKLDELIPLVRELAQL